MFRMSDHLICMDCIYRTKDPLYTFVEFATLLSELLPNTHEISCMFLTFVYLHQWLSIQASPIYCYTISYVLIVGWNAFLYDKWLVGFDLFNDDTHPLGYISRPPHVGFPHFCLSSTKRSGGVVRLRIVSVANSFKSRVVLHVWPFISDVVYIKLKKLLQLRYCSSEGLFRMSDRSYQAEESRFSQEFYNASPWNCRKESIQWVSCVVYITTFP